MTKMKIIQLQHPHALTEVEPVVLVLGFFDGVHRGHQEVIRVAREEAHRRGIPLALMTFNQHPKIVYAPMKPEEMDYLSNYERKMQLLEENGVDIVYLVEFTYQFGKQLPQEFVDRYVIGLGAVVAVAGFDYTYGPKDVANMRTLPEHASPHCQVIEVPALQMNHEKIGSTPIRQLITEGKVDLANEGLGYIYETRGVVVHGEKRGRTIGYPTANIQACSGQVQPGLGIYSVEIEVCGQWYQGMASIGYNVTFDTETGKTIEIHIFDFDQMIYGEQVKVRWYHYLRSEIKFSGVEGLIAQLQADKQATLAYFAKRAEGENDAS